MQPEIQRSNKQTLQFALTCAIPVAVGVDRVISEVGTSSLLGEALRLGEILTRGAAARLLVDIVHVLVSLVAQHVIHDIKHYDACFAILNLTGIAGPLVTGIIQFSAPFLFYWRPVEHIYIKLIEWEHHGTGSAVREWHRFCLLTLVVHLVYL